MSVRLSANDSFNLGIAFVLKHEGGFVDDPDDPGGATNLGISLRWLRAVGEDLGDIDGDGDVDVDDIRALTPDKARALYFEKFWMEPGVDQLPGPVAVAAFDFAVNAGPRQAVKCLQEAHNALCSPALACDGALGPKTTRAVEAFCYRPHGAERLVDKYLFRRIGFYQDLVGKKPQFLKYLRGWNNRVLALEAVINNGGE
jgi:lysozyme family protein